MSVLRLLDRLTNLIVAACDPDKIVLFGSHAKGQSNLDSDVDLLVIGPFTGSHYLRDRELRQLLWGVPIHVDLHVLTPEEVEADRQRPNGFTSSVLATGRTLYARSSKTEHQSH